MANNSSWNASNMVKIYFKTINITSNNESKIKIQINHHVRWSMSCIFYKDCDQSPKVIHLKFLPKSWIIFEWLSFVWYVCILFLVTIIFIKSEIYYNMENLKGISPSIRWKLDKSQNNYLSLLYTFMLLTKFLIWWA